MNKFSSVEINETEDSNKIAKRLSYYEISCIAKYLDHNDIEKFMRVSKSCLYSSCKAIIQNLEAFQRDLDQLSHKIDEDYIKSNLPDPETI